MPKFDVAAYIWPSYTGDDLRTRIFWPEGYGEWETVAAAKQLGPDHIWPRRPQWGYVNEADPNVMEMEINVALKYGVNTFIYDWYWFDGRPFLEKCLEEGFLKARNNEQMKFCVMWANHDVDYTWDRRQAWKKQPGLLYTGRANPQEFEQIKDIFKGYFRKPNYYRIDGKPVLYIYNLQNFVDTFGGYEETAQAMLRFSDEVRAEGIAPGVHWQCQVRDRVTAGAVTLPTKDVVKKLPFDSVTDYNIRHDFGTRPVEYSVALEAAQAQWSANDADFSIPYYPELSLGWDNTPRYGMSVYNEMLLNATPGRFKIALAQAKKWAEDRRRNLVVINSWNEWTEGTYLEPDDLNGYRYLEAIREVFGE